MTDYRSAKVKQPAPRSVKPPKKKTDPFTIIVGGLFAVVVFGAVAVVVLNEIGVSRPSRAELRNRERRAATPTPVADDIAVWVMAQDFVEQELTNPAAASFPSMFEAEITETVPNKAWIVRSYVDAQNQYGAMIRHEFVCVLWTEDGNTWTCESLTFSD